jgi:hypothetical protein
MPEATVGGVSRRRRAGRVGVSLAVLAALGAGYGLGHHRPGEPPGAHAVKGGTACSTALDYPGARRALARVSPGGRYGNTQFSATYGGDPADLMVGCRIDLNGGDDLIDVGTDELASEVAKAGVPVWRSFVRKEAPVLPGDRAVPVAMGNPAVSFSNAAAVRVPCHRAHGSTSVPAYTVVAEAVTNDPTLRQDLVTLDAALARYVFRVARCTGPSPIPGHAPRVSAEPRK